MKNFIQPGETINVTATGADIAAGDVVAVGKLFGIAVADIAEDAEGAVALTGVYSLPKNTSLAITKGDQLFWDASPGEITKTVTDAPIGIAFASADTADTTVHVKLTESGDNVPQAAFVAYTAGTNLVGVDGTGSNAAPLAGTETRLDAIDTAIAALKTSLIDAGLMAAS
jgi:predicted RecA/RadA family phage recombinase